MKLKTSLLSLVALCICSIAIMAFMNQATQKKVPVNKSIETSQNTEGIQWYSMTEGFSKASKENKVLIVDVYTDWCYWCKVMDLQTYGNKNVIKKMNKYCIGVKFNPEVEGNHTVNGETLSSDQLATYLNKGGRMPGYPMTFVWKTLSDQSQIAPYSGYLDTTIFNSVLNRYIQE